MKSTWIALKLPLVTGKSVVSIKDQREYHFSYFIYYLFQDKFKNPKIIKIQQVHQKLQTTQFILFYLNCFPFQFKATREM